VRLPIRIVRPDAASLPLERDEVMRFLGYKKGKTVLTPAVDAILDEGIRLALDEARPVATLVYCRVDSVSAGAISLAVPGIAWQSAALARLLRRAEAVTLVAATVGPGIEQRVRRLFAAQEYATATVVDAAGSALIQAFGRHLEWLVGEMARPRSLKATHLLCPGHADWDVADTGSLLEKVGGPAAGITCTPSAYLVPQKSLTGLIGWVAEGARLPGSGCEACGLTSCAYRKVNA
jgi:hypothetical protein